MRMPQSPAQLRAWERVIRNGEPKTTLTGRITPQPSLSAATPTLHWRIDRQSALLGVDV